MAIKPASSPRFLAQVGSAGKQLQKLILDKQRLRKIVPLTLLARLARNIQLATLQDPFVGFSVPLFIPGQARVGMLLQPLPPAHLSSKSAKGFGSMAIGDITAYIRNAPPVECPGNRAAATNFLTAVLPGTNRRVRQPHGKPKCHPQSSHERNRISTGKLLKTERSSSGIKSSARILRCGALRVVLAGRGKLGARIAHERSQAIRNIRTTPSPSQWEV